MQAQDCQLWLCRLSSEEPRGPMLWRLASHNRNISRFRQLGVPYLELAREAYPLHIEAPARPLFQLLPHLSPRSPLLPQA